MPTFLISVYSGAYKMYDLTFSYSSATICLILTDSFYAISNHHIRHLSSDRTKANY